MKRLASSAIAATLLWLVIGRAEAQDPRLKSGTMIRFRVGTNDTLHVGQLERATPDSLILLRDFAGSLLRWLP